MTKSARKSQANPASAKPASAKPASAKPASTNKKRGGASAELDSIDTVINKYKEYEWETLKIDSNTMNDIIAKKGDKMHFIIVQENSTYDDPKFHGLQKNNFVQNAMSNSAVPIIAYIKKTKSRNTGEIKNTITFTDVNLNTKVIIGKNKKN